MLILKQIIKKFLSIFFTVSMHFPFNKCVIAWKVDETKHKICKREPRYSSALHFISIFTQCFCRLDIAFFRLQKKKKKQKHYEKKYNNFTLDLIRGITWHFNRAKDCIA